MKNKKDRGSLQAPGTNGHIRWKQINIAFLCARNRDRTHPSWFVSGQYSFDSTCTYSYICFQKSIRSLFCSLSFWAAFILTHGFLFENSLYLIVRDKHWLSRWYFLRMNETSTYSWLKSRECADYFSMCASRTGDSKSLCFTGIVWAFKQFHSAQSIANTWALRGSHNHNSACTAGFL